MNLYNGWVMSPFKQVNGNRRDRGFSPLFKFIFDDSFSLYDNLVRAARSPRLKTTDLIDFATAVIVHEWQGAERQGNLALLILQERDTPEVFRHIRSLIQSDQPEERLLAARVLRASRLSQVVSKYHDEALELLHQAAKIEADHDILCWLVAAIGWNHTYQTKPYLHAFVEHAEAKVRCGVAANWIQGCTEGSLFPEDIAHVAECMCHDTDADNRWYSFSNLVDIAKFWGLASGQNAPRFQALLCEGLSDTDLGVVKQARLAIAHQKHKQLWTGPDYGVLMPYEDYVAARAANWPSAAGYSVMDYDIACDVYDEA